MPIAIRVGGYNVPGLARVDKVCVLSTTSGVRVDPVTRTACGRLRHRRPRE
jgi:hypothetical protein